MRYSRRDFLKLAAAGSAAASIAVRAAGPGQQGFTLGFSLYGMKQLSQPAAIRLCAATGYRNVELCLNPGFPGDPRLFPPQARAETKAALAETGLVVSSYMRDMPVFGVKAHQAENLAAIRSSAEIAHAVFPQGEPIIESVLGGTPADWETGKAQAAGRLREWAELADRLGVLLAVKGHAGGAVRLPAQLQWLLQQVNHPRLVVNFDQSHYQLEHVPLAESLQRLGPYIRLAHVKDSAGDAQKFRFLLAGEGQTDFTAYFSALRRAGYAGPLIAEVSAQIFNLPGYDPAATARRCYAVLAPAVAAANGG